MSIKCVLSRDSAANMYVRQLLLLALLTSDSARAAVSVPSEYNSSYTSMTVTTERYACSGELTGTRDSTQVGSVVWELEKLWEIMGP